MCPLSGHLVWFSKHRGSGLGPGALVALSFNTDDLRQLSGAAKEAGVQLPPGFVIDVADTPKCSLSTFSKEEPGFGSPATCGIGSQIGSVTLTLNLEPLAGQPVLARVIEPVYNLSTNPGEVARIGFYALEFGVSGTIVVRPGDYGGTAVFKTVKDNLLESTSLTVWGVPAAPVHNPMRGLKCVQIVGGTFRCVHESPPEPQVKVSGLSSNVPPTPFFTNLTQCSGEPLRGELFAASWEEPENRSYVPSSFGTMEGCGLLEFGPYITAAPDTTRADTPAGLTFDVKMPQEGLVDPEGLSSADIENTTTTLPEGMVINPGQAAGLGACQFSEDGIGVNGPPGCPSDSKVGEVEAETPLITRSLKGPVYVLASNPPEIKLLVSLEDPTDGLYVKFIGTVHLNDTTGQIVTTFDGTPPLPISNLRLSFSGGAQAALVTPTGCGSYQTTAGFLPMNGASEALTASSFAIESGPGSSACASPLPFAPTMTAGASTDQAGGYTDFSMLLQRADGQQRISKLQFKTPPGLLGMISHVALCEEPQAATGDCPAGSQIGHTVVGAGPGPYPLFVPEAGRPPAPIYIGGPYEGAPYSLVIVVPVVVGPFNLGTTVVRGKIEVDPQTSALTITTDALPTILDGVPADLRTIDAVIDRREFMFNPTNCDRQSFSGTATSVEGTNAALSSPFQVGSCRSLGFKPTFKASTSAKTSRTEGASLRVTLTLPDEGGLSSIANVQRVKVSLPKQLPSPLKTLQKACLEKTFAENPASCPVASQVGQVKVSTPVLPGGLTGTAYFVSHGGAKYPELIMVLTGENGVTVQVHGETFISKQGITSATFNTVPDVPFSSFELVLPQREYPAVTANGNLCKGSLVMPTEMVGQNGLVIDQNTKIAVTGCPKVKKVSHKRKGKSHGKRRGAASRPRRR